jgi:hypothetical protein
MNQASESQIQDELTRESAMRLGMMAIEKHLVFGASLPAVGELPVSNSVCGAERAKGGPAVKVAPSDGAGVP